MSICPGFADLLAHLARLVLLVPRESLTLVSALVS